MVIVVRVKSAQGKVSPPDRPFKQGQCRLGPGDLIELFFDPFDLPFTVLQLFGNIAGLILITEHLEHSFLMGGELWVRFRHYVPKLHLFRQLPNKGVFELGRLAGTGFNASRRCS